MQSKRFFLGALAALVGLAAQGCGSNVGPNTLGLYKVPPGAGGYWFITLTAPSGNFPGVMDLKDSSGGTVTGVLSSKVTGQESLSGTVSPEGDLILSYRDAASGEQGRIHGTVLASVLTGTLTITSANGDVITFLIAADQ
jgi:hypothetical protein